MIEQPDTIILELHYLPCIAYFNFLSQFKHIIFEVKENYIKQSYRNRCYILGANKVLPLSVPVHRGTGKMLTKDVRIDYSQKWVSDHWLTIKSAYGKAPFFEFYADPLYDILHRNYSFLIDLNWDLLTYCLNALNLLKKEISFSVNYLKDLESNIYEGRNLLKPNPEKSETGFFQPQSYNQVFGKNFVPNLSVIDVLFCIGPNTEDYVIKFSEFKQEVQKPSDL